MRKVTPFILLGLVFALPLAHSQTTSMEDFYRDCIMQEIEVHEVRANLVNSQSEHLQQCAEDASAQVRFYRQNKEELVQQMLDQGISNKTQAVRYFLIKTYATADAGNRTRVVIGSKSD